MKYFRKPKFCTADTPRRASCLTFGAGNVRTEAAVWQKLTTASRAARVLTIAPDTQRMA